MYYSENKNLKLDGQAFQFNTDSKVIVVEIIKLFKNAGSVLGWDESFEKEGFGINKKIIEFIIDSKSKLMIILLSTENQTHYWINYDMIQKFISKNKCDTVVSGVTLYNIPKILFAEKPQLENGN